MPFTIKKIAMRLRNDSEYIPLPGVRGEAGPGVPAGGTAGQVLAKTSSTDYATGWVDAGGSASMTILSYGNSTWADFIAAYNSNSIVYCRASSAADPSSGSQTRLAFMAYVNNASSPTSVEFQYYRSVSSHTDAQQGDQVFIYKLTSAGAWSVTVRDAFTKIAAGTNMTSSYANGTLTLNATGGGGTSDYDALSNKPSINNVTLSGNKTASDLGLRTAAAQDAIDAAQDAEIGIVITGKRPSMAVTAEQYVIVRNSTISGITDGLYTANAALSPSTDVTAANLTAVSGGGLNNLRNNLFITRNLTSDEITLAANEASGFEISVPAISQYAPFSIGQIYITGEGSNGAAFNRGFQLQTNRVLLGVRNTTAASRTWKCSCTVIYKHI